jgi:glycogen(starch) synthase
LRCLNEADSHGCFSCTVASLLLAISLTTKPLDSMKMSVLILGAFPPPHGGVQTHVAALRNFLIERNIPCEGIHLTRHRQADGNGLYYPRTALQVLKLLLRLKYDVIHNHVGGDLTLRVLGLCLVCSLIPGKRAVLTFHSGGYPSFPGANTPRRWSLRGFIFRRLDGLIGVNEEILKLFCQFGVPPERVRLIPPHAFHVNDGEVPLPPYLANFFRQHDPVLTTVSGLEPEYDLALQVDVFGLVRQSYPRAGLLIIGSGSLEEELRKRIQSMPHAEHILLAGDVPHAVTLRAIIESDLFLRTTLYDGDSISVREALHYKVPVIATDNRMRPEGVVLIPVSDPVALRNAIETELARPSSQRGYGQVDESNLETVLRFYEELLSNDLKKKSVHKYPNSSTANSRPYE